MPEPPGSSACRTARTSGSGSSGTSRGPPTTGTTAASDRASTSTSTCRCAPHDLVHVVAHETFPGHHLEHAWKEANLVERRRRLEASVLLINAPECLVSEGLADLGRPFVAPLDETPDLLVELYGRAGLPIAADPAAARDAAERSAAMTAPRRRLQESRVNAAADAPRRRRVARRRAALLVREVGRFAPDVAAKRLEFIEHPLWRTYVFVYHEGEALLAALARRRSRTGNGRPGSAGCCASS